MSQENQILVVGSVAYDDVETPFGAVTRVLGGTTLYFSAAASLFAPVRVVSVVGRDFPLDQIRFLEDRGVDFAGLQVTEGETFYWGGRYDYDLNSTETLFTKLGVYESFHPTMPEGYAESPFVFLANIQPDLQREVLQQCRNPRISVMDTMNLWINTQREGVVETMRLMDMVSINESEVRLFAGTSSVVKGARQILNLGPRAVLVKKGEYGCVMITRDDYFVAPAFPVEDVFDPTGAGDSFAGGFIGYLARTGDLSEVNMRRAVVYGSAMGSFAVEKFSIQRLVEIGEADVRRRVAEFQRLVAFDAELPA